MTQKLNNEITYLLIIRSKQKLNPNHCQIRSHLILTLTNIFVSVLKILPEWKRQFGRPRNKYNENIQLDVKCKGVKMCSGLISLRTGGVGLL
jgi:hypothetical protein